MGLNSNSVTRFPNGVTNVLENTIFNALKMPNPMLYHQYSEDFDYYNAANWTVTETQAGATQALTDGNGGLLLLTNSAADDDVNQIQKVGESFLPTLGKKFFMEARFAISDVLQSDMAIGIQVANTDATDAVTDGIYFLKADGAADLIVRCRKNTTTGATQADTGIDLVNATMVVVAVYYDGVDRLYYAVNGNVLGYLDASSSFLPDTELAPVACIKNGEAVAKTMTIDRIFCSQEQ